MYTAFALLKAVATGDIAALATCFEDPELLNLVATTERTFWSVPHPRDDWYFLPSRKPRTSLFAVAVLQDQVEVLAWLFAPERAAMMPATLATELAYTARAAFDAKNAEALELLLTVGASDLLRMYHRDWMARIILGGRQEPDVDMMRIVLAHGGVAAPTALLQYYIESGSHEALEFAVSESAIVVGTPLDYSSALVGEATLVSQTLALGMDLRATRLVAAIMRRRLGVVEELVTVGCLDVDPSVHDAAANGGVTPLIELASVAPGLVDTQELLRVTRVFLDAGADVNTATVDGETVDGETALHRAMRTMRGTGRYYPHMPAYSTTNEFEIGPYVAIVELLLQYGANPNAKDKHGSTPRDWLSTTARVFREARASCEKLLTSYGAEAPGQPVNIP